MTAFLQTASQVLGIVISVGTALTVTLPGLRRRLAARLVREDGMREEIALLRGMLEEHVAGDAAKREETALQREVDRCVLRDLITTIYYRYAKEKRIPVYALEDVNALYELYVKRGGNSYVQSLMRQIREEWEMIA